MYIPPHFALTLPQELHRVMRDHPLGVLVTAGPAGPDADHIPFEFDPAAGALGTLSGHVARANTLWQRCPSGTAVMVIFRGAEAYVSPNWYPSKHEAHRQVPTWNYEVVHVHGTLTVRDDERFVRGLVRAPDPAPRGSRTETLEDGRLRTRVHRYHAAPDSGHRDRDHLPRRQGKAQPEQGSA